MNYVPDPSWLDLDAPAAPWLVADLPEGTSVETLTTRWLALCDAGSQAGDTRTAGLVLAKLRERGGTAPVGALARVHLLLSSAESAQE